MRHSVLCVQRSRLPAAVTAAKFDLIPFEKHLNEEISPEALSFINRTVVDEKSNVNTTHFSIGTMFPQILPYTVITCEDEVLVYYRKGAEDRLHGLMSLGIGGHVDTHDASFYSLSEHINLAQTVSESALREMEEEAGISLYPSFTHYIVDNTNEVGQVHLGMLGTVDISAYGFTKRNVKPAEELYEAHWVNISRLHGMIEKFENWSQIVIKELYGSVL